MIHIKSVDEIKIMAEGGKILAEVLGQIEKMAKPGIDTLELDRAAEALILKHRAKPAFKGYENFPYSLCASVNDVIVHGFPSNNKLKEGDTVDIEFLPATGDSRIAGQTAKGSTFLVMAFVLLMGGVWLRRRRFS